jgi:tetratricopeptide (TPR) repeat protein
MLGPDHPDLSYSHFQLGHLLYSMEQPDKALVEFTLAADIDTKSLPADSPHIATDDVSLGVVLDELDRPKEALAHQLKALAILELHPKDNGKALRNALLDIANTYRTLKQNADAMRSYERALESAKSLLGPDHPEVADILNNMALAKLNTGDHAGARAAWTQALAIREARLGPAHPDVAKALGALAEEAFDRGDYKETVRLLARAVTILDGAKVPAFPLTVMMLDMLGQAQSELTQYPDAITSMTRARDGYAANHKPQDAAHCSAVLAEALWGHGDKREGAASMQQAIDGFVAAPKPDAARIGRLRSWLAQHKP